MNVRLKNVARIYTIQVAFLRYKINPILAEVIVLAI